MTQSRTRKIVLTGILGAISIVLGITRIGFIPLPIFGGISLTIMHIPVIIGAVLEGPIVGLGIGLIFGVFSLIQSFAPLSPNDAIFANPLISIFPRMLIGPVSWLVWRSLQKWQIPALIAAGIAGSLTNTVVVLGMIGLFGLFPWSLLGLTVLTNGLPEAAASAILVLIIVAAWKRISLNKKQGANLD